MEKNPVFLYPGQGSQHVGMGYELYQNHPAARKIFDRADRELGFSLSRLCFEGPEEKLNGDLNAQLAVFTTSCALTEILRDRKIRPAMVSGYSSGFYGAAFAAGCFDFPYGLKLVKRAGEILLEEAVKVDGAMAVIFGLSRQAVQDVCWQVGDVQLAILNTPRQMIISGVGESVRAAMKLSLDRGALDAYPLPVAAAYHSELMKSGGKRFLKEISEERLKDPQVPVVSYLTFEKILNKKDLKNTMAAQLSGPVLWVELIEQISHNPKQVLLEVGPGAVIFRTVRWIDRNARMMSTATMERLNAAIKALGPTNNPFAKAPMES